MEAIIFSPLDLGKVAHVPSFLHTLIVAGFETSPSTFASTFCWQVSSHVSKVKINTDFFLKLSTYFDKNI